jgi:hypothetical protein
VHQIKRPKEFVPLSLLLPVNILWGSLPDESIACNRRLFSRFFWCSLDGRRRQGQCER